jgi:hypothetical protein
MSPVRTALSLLAALAAVARADAQSVLYGGTGSNGPGQLVTLNPNTGAVVSTIGPTNDAGGNNYGLTGMAYNPVNGLLYGSSGNGSNYPAATRAHLVTVNPTTGRVTDIGAFNVGAGNSMTDLAFTSTGVLYGIGSSGGANLFSINITTGQATLVGSSGISFTAGGGLAISSAGTLFSSPTKPQFGTYNSSTGAYTNIAAPSSYPVGGGSYAALKFNDSGVLYGVNLDDGVAGRPTHLVTINPATAAVTDIGASVAFLDSIAFVPVPEPAFILAGCVALPAAVWMRRRRPNV